MVKLKKVIVALSGGVDSAVAALLLKLKGFYIEAVFMQNWDIADETGICKANDDYEDASFICQQLKVPLHRVNFVKEYWNEVFCELLHEYQQGYTPNPDVLCNRFIKFHHFYNFAKQQLNADAIATGHYVRTSFGSYLENYKPNEAVRLLKAKDRKKDQTLFLCQIQQEALRRSMFPLGDYTKTEVKQIARENELDFVAKKKESMGICFIGSRNFPKFISEYVKEKPGHFIDIDSGRVVGKHFGIHQWTLGQRTKLQGLPVAYFTVKKDNDTNNIYVALGTDHPALFSKLLYTSKPHWIHLKPKDLDDGVLECDFKFQHVEKFIKCIVFETKKGLIVALECDRRALTPGQFACLYKNNECLGSAKITGAGPSRFALNLLRKNFNIFRDMQCKLFKTSEAINDQDDNSNLQKL